MISPPSSASSTPPATPAAPAPEASGSPARPPATTEADAPRGAWDWPTFLALCVLAYHILVLWYRWLRPDPDFLNFTSRVASLLAIASFLGLQTASGRRLAIRLDKALGLRRVLRTPRRTFFAVAASAMIAALLLYVGSPVAATLLDRHGAAALEDGRYSVATRDFRQAISLVPTNARAHHNLGAAYAALNDTQHAIAEYQAALELDDSFWPTYNELGRLYLQSGSSPTAALTTLLAGQRRADDVLGQAVIGKNLAWAYLELELPRAALAAVDDVMADLQILRSQGDSVEVYLAEVYHLQAQAYEAMSSPAEAQSAWQDCLGFALTLAESEACIKGGTHPPPDCLDALRWAAEAREWLAEHTGGP